MIQHNGFQDAETIASKNNLTFTELLQPFSKMGTDVTIKDVDGQNHNVASLNLILGLGAEVGVPSGA